MFGIQILVYASYNLQAIESNEFRKSIRNLSRPFSELVVPNRFDGAPIPPLLGSQIYLSAAGRKGDCDDNEWCY